jgi:hypothetical protein
MCGTASEQRADRERAWEVLISFDPAKRMERSGTFCCCPEILIARQDGFALIFDPFWVALPPPPRENKRGVVLIAIFIAVGS